MSKPSAFISKYERSNIKNIKHLGGKKKFLNVVSFKLATLSQRPSVT